MKAKVILAITFSASAAAMIASGADSRPEQVDRARLGLATETRAHVTLVPRSLETTAGLASAMVQADVVAVRTIDVPGQHLRTEYELRVADCYFGEVGGTVRVQVAGGHTATRSFVVEGAPGLAVGDRGVFFLGGETEPGALSFLGLDRGCYALETVGDVVSVRGGEHAPEPIELAQFVARTFDAREAYFAQEAR